jgi:hypothetical protein
MTAEDSHPEGQDVEAIVVKKKKKKKKRRYTRGSRDLQELGRGYTRSATRVADAVAQGLDEYRSLSNKSSRKKRDGAIRDLPENLSLALGVTMRRASRAAYDVARRLRTRRLWKQTRVLLSPFSIIW